MPQKKQYHDRLYASELRSKDSFSPLGPPPLSSRCTLLLLSVNLGIAEVHLGVLLLELLEDIHLLLLVARRQACLLLTLVVHHLLDHSPGLAVEVRQLAVLGRDFGDVNLGRVCHDVCPPLHLVDLVEVDLERLGAVGGGDERPG